MKKKKFPYNTIRSSTLAQLREEQLVYSARLTPLERMAYLMELNLNAFGKASLNLKMERVIRPGDIR